MSNEERELEAEDLPLVVAQAKQSFSLAPRTLSEAMQFAEMMAKSELVPKQFRGKAADVMIAVQMGAEVGLAPMGAIQNIAVINGKPGIYGDAGKAILLANGCIIEEDDTEAIKTNGRARCKITRKGRPPVERTFSIDDAKTANLWNKEGPWRSYPYRQMAWRAFWFAARDAASDLLKGLGGAEELSDIVEKDINPPPPKNAKPADVAKRKNEITGPSPELLQAARDAADKGTDAFAAFWKTIKAVERGALRNEISALQEKCEVADRKEQQGLVDDFVTDMDRHTGSNGEYQSE